MEGESALTVSLEELGLSRYEARAYVALITKGTMSAGDLAFYSEIPRAKIYSTMKKLASKNLAITSNTKSAMVCTAVRPEDAFDGIIHEQIQKVTAMNALVADLKNISEMNRRAGDSEEKRYMQIGAGSVLPKLQEMTINAEASIIITADDGGLGLLSGCRDQLLAAQKKDVSIRCIIPHGEVCSESHRALPRGVESRASHDASGSCIVFDGTDVMILDGADGRGAVFESASTLGSAHTAIFEKAWSESMPVDALADMAPEDARQICRIISATGAGGLQYLLEEMAGGAPRNVGNDSGGHAARLYGLLEQDGIAPDSKRPLAEVLGMFDAIMQIMCSGSACMDAGGRNVTVESPQNSNSSLPWVSMLEGCLRGRGYAIRTVRQSSPSPKHGDAGERFHIRIDKN
ncbi:MAG: TrmB family transcriptional regulator [Nitrosopumilaceae archaeon]|nr:TrmB family transcriptional regulator [Nitrosopumilaceae archaeon]